VKLANFRSREGTQRKASFSKPGKMDLPMISTWWRRTCKQSTYRNKPNEGCWLLFLWSWGWVRSFQSLSCWMKTCRRRCYLHAVNYKEKFRISQRELWGKGSPEEWDVLLNIHCPDLQAISTSGGKSTFRLRTELVTCWDLSCSAFTGLLCTRLYSAGVMVFAFISL